MLKQVAISALLCAFLIETGAEKNASVAREVKLQHSHPYTVVIQPHIFTIAKNETHLLLESTDPNFKPCAIAFDDHSMQQRIEATAIGRKILVWGIRTKYETDIGDKIEHEVLIVDPRQCTLKAASTFEEERPPGAANADENLARVVAHKDSFDVFYPSLKTCAPCRYSIDGKRIDLQHQLEVNHTLRTTADTFFRIQSYDKLGHEDGYFYAYNFGNGSSVIKLLDKNFQVVKQKYLDHTVDVIAAEPTARTSGVHVCYMTQAPWRHNANDTIYCERYDDANLELLKKIRLPMLEGHSPDALAMTVGPLGDLYVPVVQSLPRGSSQEKIGYYRADENGKLDDVTTVHQLPEEIYGRWKIRGYFADMKYCIENTDDNGARNAEHQFVKCVSI